MIRTFKFTYRGQGLTVAEIVHTQLREMFGGTIYESVEHGPVLDTYAHPAEIERFLPRDIDFYEVNQNQPQN